MERCTGCRPARARSWSRSPSTRSSRARCSSRASSRVREAARRRDQIVQGFAQLLDAENAEAARRGLIPRFASPHDPLAIVGAIGELVSRQVRLGVPGDVLELAPVIDRLISGLLARAS